MCWIAGKVNCRAAPFWLNKNGAVSNANILRDQPISNYSGVRRTFELRSVRRKPKSLSEANALVTKWREASRDFNHWQLTVTVPSVSSLL